MELHPSLVMLWYNSEAKYSTVTVLGSVGSNVMVQGFERKVTTGGKETKHAEIRETGWQREPGT